MLRGKGGLIGPDLSNLASERRLNSIRDALTKAQHKAAGGRRGAGLMPSSRYQPVRVVTRDGNTVSGIVRNEDNFSLQILGSDNALHLFLREELREVTYESKSVMPTDSDLLNHAPCLHVFLDRCSLLQRTIETGSADTGQLTHALDA